MKSLGRIVLAAPLAAMMFGGSALAGDSGVKIGVLTDLTSFAASSMGPGSVLATQLAVEDFGGRVNGKPIEVIQADMQSKPDLAVQIARRWYEADNVDVIVDVPASAAAITIQAMATEMNKTFLGTVAATPVLTGRGCSPNAVHWISNTQSLARSLVGAMAAEGAKTWFLLMPDYQLGKDLAAEATPAIAAAGGRVLETVYYPTGTGDFAQYLLRAQASGADAIGTGGVGLDLSTQIKQAVEFGILPGSKQRLGAFVLNLSDIHAVGLQTMQGVWVMQEFYWDHDEETRAFGKKFIARFNRMPNFTHASNYSAVLAYLNAAKELGNEDPKKVMAHLKEKGAKKFSERVAIRSDGRTLSRQELYRVKSPADSKYPFDYLKHVSTIAADKIYPPADPAACSLVK